MTMLVLACLSLGLLMPSVKATDITSITREAGYEVSEAIAPKASIVVNAANGQILWGDNIDLQRDPASTTKTMVIYLTMNAIKEGKISMDTEVVATANDQAIADIYELSNNKIKEGVTYTVSELLTMTFVASATTSGMRVITVILNADGWEENAGARFIATNDLLNHIAGNYYPLTILKKGKNLDKTKASILDGKQGEVNLISQKALTVIKSTKDKETPSISYQAKQELIFAPVAKKENLGNFVYEDKHVIGKGYLYSQPSVPALAQDKVDKSFFLKVWWNHFVRYVNDYL